MTTNKEYDVNALTTAKEAEALADAQPNSEAKSEVTSHPREAEECELTTQVVQ